MPSKYDKIGVKYNATRKTDKYLGGRLLYFLNPKPGGIYLDIGCGTGNYTSALQKKGLNFIGIDPSDVMLEKARENNPDIDWRIGTADNTDLESGSVDGVLASLTIHHWDSLYAGFKEMNRILKSGGRIVIFTSTPEQMKGYWLNEYFPKMLDDSIIQMPSFKSVEEALSKAGFSISETEKYFVKPDLEDLFLYSGKHDPEMYFNPEIRNGISSFSSLANAAEVARGLEKLRADIDSGKIKEVMESYENDSGDYLFVVAKKD